MGSELLWELLLDDVRLFMLMSTVGIEELVPVFKASRIRLTCTGAVDVCSRLHWS